MYAMQCKQYKSPKPHNALPRCERERERKLYNKICFIIISLVTVCWVVLRRSANEWCVHTTPFFPIYRARYIWKKTNKKKHSELYFIFHVFFTQLPFLYELALGSWHLIHIDFFFLSPARSLLHWASSQCVSLESVSMFLHFSHQKQFSFPFKIKLIFLINHQVEDAYDQWT